MTLANSDWDQSSIVVVPGLPGELSTPVGAQTIYPGSTLAFVKRLRAQGYPVKVATPNSIREVNHHAADEWLPLVNFGLQILAGGGGNVLASILLDTFGSSPRRKTTAHIRWNVQSQDGAVHEFIFDGDSETAIETARSFERSLGYGNDAS